MPSLIAKLRVMIPELRAEQEAQRLTQASVPKEALAQESTRVPFDDAVRAAAGKTIYHGWSDAESKWWWKWWWAWSDTAAATRGDCLEPGQLAVDKLVVALLVDATKSLSREATPHRESYALQLKPQSLCPRHGNWYRQGEQCPRCVV